MYPIIAHVYGSFSIHSYGLAIVLGLLVFSYLLLTDKRSKELISVEEASLLLVIAIFAALVGGKIFYLAIYTPDMFSVDDLYLLTNGGLSVLGSTLGIGVTLYGYAIKKSLPFFKLCDLITLYAPLLQAFGRIGCFFAGCCFGTITNCWCAINLPDQYGIYALRHPTQLYSALLLMIIFLYGYYRVQNYTKKPGAITAFYLISVCAERFINEYFRAEKPFSSIKILSAITINQCIAIIFMLFGIMLFLYPKATEKHEPF